MPLSSREVIGTLHRAGWRHVGTTGDHWPSNTRTSRVSDEPGEEPLPNLVRLLVPADLPATSARLDVTLDEELAVRVDAAARARGLSRSALLAEGARRLLASG